MGPWCNCDREEVEKPPVSSQTGGVMQTASQDTSMVTKWTYDMEVSLDASSL